jgi:2'-5' RNA ligase
VRTFIAIEIDDGIRERLGRAQQGLRGQGPKVKWVDPAKVHLTLKFLGEIEEGAVEGVAAAMGRAVAGMAPFEMTVGGLGAFPPRGAPRVVWAGVADPSGGLATLHGRLERELGPLGFEPEGRPFRPHLTLGRVKDRRGGAPLPARIAAGAREEFGVQTVAELVLFLSTLSPAGPTYTPLRRARLG